MDGAMLCGAGKSWRVWMVALGAGCALLGGCDRMMTPRGTQMVKDADARATQADYAGAINLYESALDDTAASAEVHYKLALVYDDKLNEPLHAIHHFKRYLALAPTGSRANEVKQFIKRDQLTLLTSLSGDSVVTRSEAASLLNENLTLRKQIAERSVKSMPNQKADAATPRNESHPHSYEVQQGDTLFSIARKMYNSPGRWKEIRDANRDKIGNGSQLKPGETLRIP